MKTFEEIKRITSEAVAELVSTVYEEGYKQGKLHAQMNEQFSKVRELVKEETPQQKRDRIVEQAKADIYALMPEHGPFGGQYYEVFHEGVSMICNADFSVNKEKRTVVAIMKGFLVPNVYVRGIAKCAPDDCFNVHIGKAIALRRALDLEVPKEYMNAPNPKEARVGDVVQNKKYGHLVGTVTQFEPRLDSLRHGRGFRHTHDNGWLGEKQVQIIDDSRDE